MVNIFAGRPTIVIGRVNRAFIDAGINVGNTAKIVKIADPFLSYEPSQQINSVDAFEIDVAYFYFAIQNIDLEGVADNVVPPGFLITPGVNVFANKWWAGIGLQTGSFITAGITAANTDIIYLIDSAYFSYTPGQVVNGITGFELNRCYYGLAKADIDLSAWIMPPVVQDFANDGEPKSLIYVATAALTTFSVPTLLGKKIIAVVSRRAIPFKLIYNGTPLEDEIKRLVQLGPDFELGFETEIGEKFQFIYQ